ncbi:MAG: hypothetical protein O3A53_19950 [Acidobacteria bacterium]|nr:hypothetical protein [Acidobacteriota bacterium]MDA1237053.1 hypothetical protein [Acidobacteriota bacterium]
MVDITKPPETDQLRVEIRLEGDDFWFVRETAAGFEVVIFGRDDDDRWCVQVEELVTVLERAKRKLLG